jgi:L-lactate dehydrogenase complex protein LldG
MLASGPDNPTTLNFLPDTHIVVVNAKDIAPDYETLWQRLRESYGAGAMPRAVNWITGPSRSADIEQTLILGAHGPRRLHVIVVEE